MGKMEHPKTGEQVRTETVCENSPPDYEHCFCIKIVDNWAEQRWACCQCRLEIP